jgi:hypothetical protein
MFTTGRLPTERPVPDLRYPPEEDGSCLKPRNRRKLLEEADEDQKSRAQDEAMMTYFGLKPNDP